MNLYEEIQERLPRGELLCQLSEEASELAKAALKLRRAEDGTNPTPVTVEEATDNLLEEIGDVLLCLEVLEIDLLHEKIDGSTHSKLSRWVRRLNEDDEKRKREREDSESDLVDDLTWF